VGADAQALSSSAIAGDHLLIGQIIPLRARRGPLAPCWCVPWRSA